MTEIIPRTPEPDSRRTGGELDPVLQAWRQLVNAVAELFRGRASRVRPWVDQAEKQVHEWSQGMGQQLGGEASRAANATRRFVQERPVQAMGIAAAAALLLAALVRRK